MNLDRPDRHTVKLPLSILNTLVWRGLPTERTLAAPGRHRLGARPARRGPLSAGRMRRDPARRGRLRHRRAPRSTTSSPRCRTSTRNSSARSGANPSAGLAARGSAPVPSPPSSTPTRGPRLHRRAGRPLRADPRRLAAAALRRPAAPLLHFLYRYGTVFSPHGENAIVVFDDHDVPVRLAIKDFVDDVNVSAQPLPEHDAMPDDVRGVLLTEEPAFLTQFIHSGLFVGVFRYLAPLCEEQLGVPEAQFFRSYGRRSCGTRPASRSSRTATSCSICSLRVSSASV